MSVRTMIRWAMLGLVLCGGLGAGYVAGAQDAAKEEPAKKPSTLEVGQVLRVGSRIITAEDLIARIREAEMEDPKGKRFVEPSLLYLRDVALLDLEAERQGLKLSPEEVATCTRQQIDGWQAEVKRQYKGILTWRDFLKEQFGMTEQQFEAHVHERVPVILRRRMLVNYFLRATEGVEVWRILVEKQAEAEDVYNKLTKAPQGERTPLFKALAVQKSVDRGSGLNEGRVGRVYKDAWVLDPPGSEAAVWALQDYEVAKPLKGQGGWNVLMRGQSFKPAAKSFHEMRDELLNAPDVDAHASNTWVLWVGNTQKYPIEQRVPGIDCKPNQKAGK